jgi:hypothetical protein
MMENRETFSYAISRCSISSEQFKHLLNIWTSRNGPIKFEESETDPPEERPYAPAFKFSPLAWRYAIKEVERIKELEETEKQNDWILEQKKLRKEKKRINREKAEKRFAKFMKRRREAELEEAQNNSQSQDLSQLFILDTTSHEVRIKEVIEQQNNSILQFENKREVIEEEAENDTLAPKA